MAWPDIIPFIRYEDPTAMLEWLNRAFGFEKHTAYEDDGRIVHAEVTYGTGMFMVGPTREGAPDSAQTPKQLGGKATGGMYVIVADPDAHCEQAKDAGAVITRGPEDMDYGSREYSARDPEGHTWSFGTYRPE
jgi:uncharacterized glyoxalase superfamily protein PhnB